MELLYLIYWIRSKCSYGYYGFGFSELINIPVCLSCCFNTWTWTHFLLKIVRCLSIGAFSPLHADRCVVLSPFEMKQLHFWYFVFCKLLNIQDQLLEVVPVPCTVLSCILIAIVLNIRVCFFSSAFWKVIFLGRDYSSV